MTALRPPLSSGNRGTGSPRPDAAGCGRGGFLVAPVAAGERPGEVRLTSAHRTAGAQAEMYLNAGKNTIQYSLPRQHCFQQIDAE